MQKHSPIFKPFNASNYKVGIVVAQFNSEITDQLLASAIKTLKEYEVKPKNVAVYKVAGCVEIPVVLKKLAVSKKYDCLIALGAVIKGETDHYTAVNKIVCDGVLQVMLDHQIAIGFGVLMTANLKQAKARLDAGSSAVTAALQTARILKSM